MSTRLPGAKYKDVFDRGRSLKGRLMAAWALEMPDAGRMAGVVVSKRSFHDATDRNRAKRILREGFRLLAPRLPAHVAWVFVGRSSLKDKRTADVMAEIGYLARRAGFSGDATPCVSS